MIQLAVLFISISAMIFGCDTQLQGDGGVDKKQFQGSKEPEPEEKSVAGGNKNDESDNGNGGAGLEEEESEIEEGEGGLDEDDGEAEESLAVAVKINFLRVDSFGPDIKFKIKKTDDSWQEFDADKDAGEVTIDDVCYKGKICKLEIKAIDDDDPEILASDRESFIGLEISSSEIGVGYEKLRNGDDYHNIDDIIMTITVEDAESIEVEGLNMTGTTCNLSDWVEDDNCGGLF